MPSRQEILDRTREKYPEYRDIPDDQLATALSKKYPAYATDLAAPQEPPEDRGYSGEPMSREQSRPAAAKRVLERNLKAGIGRDLILKPDGGLGVVGGGIGGSIFSKLRGLGEGVTFGGSEALLAEAERAMKLRAQQRREQGLPPDALSLDPAYEQAGGFLKATEAQNPLSKEIGLQASMLLPGGKAAQKVVTAPLSVGRKVVSGGLHGAGAVAAFGAAENVAEQIRDKDRGITQVDVGEVASTALDPKNLAIGAALGAGAGRLGAKTGRTPEQIKAVAEKTFTENGQVYRALLNPGKGEIDKIEVKSKKNMDDFFKLAAEEGVVVKKSGDNKLDTTDARAQLQDKISSINDALTDAIDSQPQKQFRLNQLRERAKRGLRELFSNDVEYRDALATVDKEIDAAIAERGEVVDGRTLNDIKRGMWSKAYDQTAPNNNKVARRIGFIAKDAIEQAYKDDADIAGLNKKMGDYMTLNHLLERAQGRIVARGKLGKYASEVAGAAVGATAGHAVGLPGGEIIGGVIGRKLARTIDDAIVDPERITSKLAKDAEEFRQPPPPASSRPVTNRTPGQIDAAERYRQQLIESEREKSRGQFLEQGEPVAARLQLQDAARRMAQQAQERPEPRGPMIEKAQSIKEGVAAEEHGRRGFMQEAEATSGRLAEKELARKAEEARLAEQKSLEEAYQRLARQAQMQRAAQGQKERVNRVVIDPKTREMHIENITSPQDWVGPRVPASEEANAVLSKVADDLNHGRTTPEQASLAIAASLKKKDIESRESLSQRRARPGGEIGPNNEFYEGGKWIATTEMPKRHREQIEKATTGRVQFEPGYGGDKWAVPEPGKLALMEVMRAADMNVRDGSLNMEYLRHTGVSAEKMAQFEKASEAWRRGERWVNAEEYPLLGNFSDFARILKAGGKLTEQMEAKIAEFPKERQDLLASLKKSVQRETPSSISDSYRTAFPESQTPRISAAIDRAAGKDHGIEVYHDPSDMSGGHGVEARYDSDGKIRVNSAYAREGDIPTILREEWGHQLLATPRGQARLSEFMRQNPITEQQRASLLEAGYHPKAGETPAEYTRRLHDEFVAKKGAELGWFRDHVDRLVVWAKQKLGITLTQDQAARALLRDLRRDITGERILRQNGIPPVVRGKDFVSESTATTPPAAVDPSKGIATPRFSLASWNRTDKEQMVKDIVATGIADERKARKWIKDISSVAAMIHANPEKLDYIASPEFKALKINADHFYGISEDYSTICRKGSVQLATYAEIMKRIGGLTPEQAMEVRAALRMENVPVTCAACYVWSRKIQVGPHLDRLAELFPTVPRDIIFDPNKSDLLKQRPETIPVMVKGKMKQMNPYEWLLARGSGVGKAFEVRTEYDRDVLKQLSPDFARRQNRFSGLRSQSWSDFEILHAIDKMQSAVDKFMLGLMGHSYTKVPEYVEFVARSNEMTNMSLMPLGTGLDARGRLVFDGVEGMDAGTAFKLRKKYDKTAGTIVIGATDQHIRAALRDPRIDYVIPYHASGLKGELREASEVRGWKDYTDSQHEGVADQAKFDAYMKRKKAQGFTAKQTEARPFEYWDKTKTGDENGQLYLAFCKENGISPKFPQFAKEPGYWKLLVDRRMFDNNGKYIEQQVIRPDFDMAQVKRMFQKHLSGEWEGAGSEKPNMKVVEQFVAKYKGASK